MERIMSKAEEFCAVLRRVFEGDEEGEAFHGPCFLHVIDGVDGNAAQFRPAQGAHSIADLVDHLKVWRRALCAALAGEPRPSLNEEKDWWPEPAGSGRDSWSRSVDELKTLQSRLLSLLGGLDDTAMERQASGLTFLLHHDLYHTGQIAILKRLSKTIR